ncbi:MAG TPA: alpha/beta fold hydrolase [Gemmatimonadaceae bacterium]|nr:alpha/beta fold hydrolase [Gemmatimonadaceae bacterium]
MTLFRLSGLLLGAPIVLGAQTASERAGYYMLSGRDTIFAERSLRTPTELSGEILDRVRGSRIIYRATLAPNGLVAQMETRVFATSGDTLGRQGTLRFDGDSVVADMGRGLVHIPSATGALLFVNGSSAFLEQIILHAREIGPGQTTVLYPIFITSVAQTAPLTVTFIGADSATIDFGSVSARVAVSPSGRFLSAAVAAQNITIVRVDDVRLVAPDRYTAPTDAPYTAEDVEVRTPAGLRLTGTLTIPRGRVGGRAPAIVTITGSGPEDRDEESSALPGYRPFRELADTLGRRGIAVLRLDDRGVNGSDVGPLTATTADFADDIRAAVAYLRSRSEIDGARIGLVGHSEGAIIAPMVASTDPQLRAIVSMAAHASTGREIVAEQNRYLIDSVAHLQGAARDSTMARARRSADSVAGKRAWETFFFAYDPTAVARRVKTPVLILHGETDRQIAVSEATKLSAAFRAGGNVDVTMRTFPETNHLFVADPSGAFRDAAGNVAYASLLSLRVRREVLGVIADWLSARLK